MDFRDHPEYGDFVDFLKLKGVVPRTIGEYERILKYPFAFVGLGEAATSMVTAEQM